MPATKLDRRTIDSLPGPAAGKGEVTHWDADLPGFGLRVLASGARTWILRYRIGERSRVVSLGKGSALSPAEARKTAGTILAKAKLGQDTRTEVSQARARASDTFEKLAERYLQTIEPRRRASYVRDVRRFCSPTPSRCTRCRWRRLPATAWPACSRTWRPARRSRPTVAALLCRLSSAGP